jgi:hypothetical protein
LAFNTGLEDIIRRFNLINKTTYVDFTSPINKVLNFTWSNDSSLLFCLDPFTFITYKIEMATPYRQSQLINTYVSSAGTIGMDFKYMKNTNQLAILAIGNSTNVLTNKLFFIIQYLNGSLPDSYNETTNYKISKV